MGGGDHLGGQISQCDSAGAAITGRGFRPDKHLVFEPETHVFQDGGRLILWKMKGRGVKQDEFGNVGITSGNVATRGNLVNSVGKESERVTYRGNELVFSGMDFFYQLFFVDSGGRLVGIYI